MVCEPGRTITYSLYLPESAVAGITFRKSYALLDGWAVRAFVGLGIPAEYREINDIISPRGKIAGAAQAQREIARDHLAARERAAAAEVVGSGVDRSGVGADHIRAGRNPARERVGEDPVADHPDRRQQRERFRRRALSKRARARSGHGWATPDIIAANL